MSQQEPSETHGAPAHARGARLLDREVSEEYRQEQTLHVAAPKENVAMGATSVVIFRVATEWLALPTGVIQGVEACSLTHTLPNHRRILNGIVNVRGELLLSVSLSALLQSGKTAEAGGSGTSAPSRRLLICNRQGNKFAFPVDEIRGVHRYHPKDLRSIPATLAKAGTGAYIHSVLAWGDKTIGCIDDELLFYAVAKSLT